MNNLYILREIARWNKSVWRLFSLLNKEMNEYFNVKGRKYEICFRMIEKNERGTWYYLNGLLHRSDGPAMIYDNGDKMWCRNDQFHRLDGPAIIYINCSYEWFVNGKRHRTDGPAVEYVEDDMKKYNEWWIDGEKITKDDER